jgi:phage baseplate assembly protein W
MPQYIGFSTINANKPKTTNAQAGSAGGFGTTQPGGGLNTGKKYRLVDEQLVLRDFINAMNITKGQKTGQPEYGTTIWNFVFDPNTYDVVSKLETEIRRVASLDPRLQINTIKASPNKNGILVEVQLAIAPFNNAQVVSVFFNPETNRANLQ